MTGASEPRRDPTKAETVLASGYRPCSTCSTVEPWRFLEMGLDEIWDSVENCVGHTESLVTADGFEVCVTQPPEAVRISLGAAAARAEVNQRA